MYSDSSSNGSGATYVKPIHPRLSSGDITYIIIYPYTRPREAMHFSMEGGGDVLFR